MDVITIYLTTPNRELALRIAHELIEQQLIACANILGEITSVYHWDGAIHNDPEIGMFLKTRSHLLDAVTRQIQRRHPYKCPCIVAWNTIGGNEAYSDWVRQETLPETPPNAA